jgi:predicted site-specific integrase-resolvase
LQQFIAEEILTTPEALEYLGITRQALNSLVHRGKIKPIKDLNGIRLYFKEDLGERKVEAEGLKKKYRPYD